MKVTRTKTIVFSMVPYSSHNLKHPLLIPLTDDLPIIRENVRKGFFETQAKVNKWISDFKKKIDGEDEDEMDSPPVASSYRPSHERARFDTAQNFRRNTEARRRSGDIQRYDSDPRVLDDNFTELELRDDEGMTATVTSLSLQVA